MRETCTPNHRQVRLSQEGKLGLRWRIEREVVSGKGQFTCGAKVRELGFRV